MINGEITGRESEQPRKSLPDSGRNEEQKKNPRLGERSVGTAGNRGILEEESLFLGGERCQKCVSNIPGGGRAEQTFDKIGVSSYRMVVRSCTSRTRVRVRARGEGRGCGKRAASGIFPKKLLFTDREKLNGSALPGLS